MKIAIECANEREHMALMRHMESRGWVYKAGSKPTAYPFESDYPIVPYHDGFLRNPRAFAKEIDHIIPFAVFAELMQIEISRYTYDANTLDVSGVDSLTYEQVCEVAKLMGEMRK